MSQRAYDKEKARAYREAEKVRRSAAAVEAATTLGTMQIEPYVDIHVAAAALAVPVSWLYRQSMEAKIPVRRFGKYLRFRISELEQWAQSGINGNGKS